MHYYYYLQHKFTVCLYQTYACSCTLKLLFLTAIYTLNPRSAKNNHQLEKCNFLFMSASNFYENKVFCNVESLIVV